MTQELFLILFSWAVYLSPYSMPTELPTLELRNHAWFVEHVCPTMDDCNVVAWYNDTGVIYLDEALDPKDGFTTAIVVHEAVHYLQNANADPCWREKEAYAVQNKYIVEVLTTLQRAKPVCRAKPIKQPPLGAKML